MPVLKKGDVMIAKGIPNRAELEDCAVRVLEKITVLNGRTAVDPDGIYLFSRDHDGVNVEVVHTQEKLRIKRRHLVGPVRDVQESEGESEEESDEDEDHVPTATERDMLMQLIDCGLDCDFDAKPMQPLSAREEAELAAFEADLEERNPSRAPGEGRAGGRARGRGARMRRMRG